jgi:hypothetical protein
MSGMTLNFKSISGRLTCGVALSVGVIAYIVGLSLQVTPFVQADPSAANNTQLQCQQALPSSMQSACSSSQMITPNGKSISLIQAARNVASHSCTTSSTADQETCIDNATQGYINKADTSSKAAFIKSLTNVLVSAANGDKSQLLNAASTAQQSLPPTTVGPGSSTGLCANNACADAGQNCSNDSCDFIGKYINPAIDLLSVSFGLIAVISIIAGGIQYTASAGDPQQASKAKSRITNTIIAVFAYLFLYAFLQFLVPGGIFNR